MRQIRTSIAIHVVVSLVFVQGASALLPSFPTKILSSSGDAFYQNPPLSIALKQQQQQQQQQQQHRSFRHPYDISSSQRSLTLSSTISGDETKTKSQQAAVDENDDATATTTIPSTIISTHLQKASLALDNDDMPTQQKEMEYAERALIAWVEEYRAMRSRSSSTTTTSSNNSSADTTSSSPSTSPVQQPELPDAQIFTNVIEGLLALPSSFAMSTNDSTKDGTNRNLRNQRSESKKSDKATNILDLMESFHEPTGSLYDTIIASHGVDSLQCLSYFMATERGNEDDGEDGGGEDGNESRSKQLLFYQQAWKSARSALQLLNRSEELYHETGQSSSRLPSISSYVTVMDVWKALAVGAEEEDEKKKRDEALEVVRNLRQRRLRVYTLDKDATGQNGGREGSSGFSTLPQGVVTMTVEEVLDFSVNLLRECVPSYELKIEDTSKIGTWHFNQLIFDLAKYPQSFSGSLAQDLLDYMIYTVKKATPPPKHRRRNKKKKQSASSSLSPKQPIIPKPNVETINGVLKAWMVNKNNQSDVARRAEAVLAKLAIWQSEGILWGVSADTVSYNTCINCWKDSGIPGAAQRATDILRLMEDESTIVNPDVVSYATCVGAWADCAAHDPSAGRNAEEILMRMYERSKDAEGAEGEDAVAPRPTTRCFNAVLLAYANGRQSGGGKRALELLRFMERLNAEGYEDLSPDRYTFNIIMKALLCCGERGASQKANQLLQRMEASYGKGDTRLKPDLLSYNTVLDAFSKEGDGKSAERLLEQMLNSGDDMVKPNAHSYTAVLTAWSRSEDKAKGVRRAEELFDDMERRYAAGKSDFHPETSVYNALINCWAKSGDRKALYRVIQILSLMEELGLKGGDSNVQPNSRTYCAVLDTLANSRNYKAYDESLKILKRMEDFYSEGYDSVRPCARAYSICLSTIARSRRKNKVVKAQELLHRMESEYRGGNSACRPTVYSYNAVLNAAAFSGRDEKEQEEAFRVACLTFDELRMSDYLQPSHVSYGTFLKAIKKLMPESDVRDNLVKGLFRKCCRDGVASDFVLKEMAGLSTPGLYQSLLEGVTNEYGNLPKSWSANVR